jgi:hypothetical protein
VTFLPGGPPPAAKLAEACRKVSGGDPVLWAKVTVENLSGSVLVPSVVTVVTGDGEQLRLENAVGTINAWQAAASTNDAKTKCYEYNTRGNFTQMGLGVAPGAKVVELNSAPATVKSVKAVSLALNGTAVSLEYA